MKAKKYMYGMIRACSIVAIASVLGGVSYSAYAEDSAPNWQNEWKDGKRQDSKVGQWLGTNENQDATLNNQTFNGQSAEEAGGAVANFSHKKLDINKVTFSNNKVNGSNYNRTDRGPEDGKVNGGGALFLGSGSHTTVTGSTFSGNTSTGDGGAVATRWDKDQPNSAENKTAELTINQSTFTNNESASWGGALYNTFDNLNAKNNTFTGNKALVGGAFANEGGRKNNDKTPTLDGSVFKNNVAKSKDGQAASGLGGAIYNGPQGVISLDNTTFTGNHADQFGGAVLNSKDATISSLKNATFSGNTAGQGGAIWNKGKIENLSGKFVNNSSAEKRNGGAIANGDSGDLTTDKDGSTTFANNNSGWHGGAVSNTGKLKLQGDVTFSGNKAVKYGGAIYNELSSAELDFANSNAVFSGNSAEMGGAIENNKSAKIKNLAGTFVNNSSSHNGGAIANAGGATLETATDGTLTFSGNVAGGDGGAISNSATLKLNGTTEFTNNTASGNFSTDKNAGGYGGAISNIGTLEISGDTTFANNTAAVAGGAIYNGKNGKLDFKSGIVTFSGNMANGVKNDIVNNGTITINGTAAAAAASIAEPLAENAPAKVVLDGGINGDGELIVSNGGILDVGTSTVSQKNIHLVDKSEVHFTLQDQDNYGKLVVSGEGSSIKGGTKDDAVLVIDYIGEAGTYNILQGELDKDTDKEFETKIAGAASKIFDKSDKDLTDDKVTFVVKSAEDMAKNLTGATGSTIGSIRAVAQNERLSKVSIAMQKVLNEMATDDEEADYSAASAYIDREVSGAKSHQSPIVHALTTQLQHQALNLAQNRMDTRIDQNTPANVWADGSLNWSKYNGGFKGRDASIAAGADFAVDNAVRVGLGYAYNQGSMWESNRDIDIDSHTLMAYAQYKPADWFVNGTVSYSMSELDESIDMLGLELGGKHDVDALGMSLMGGYDLAYGLTPTVGVRYLHINGDDWDNGAMKVKMDSYDFVTGVLGLRYAQTVFDMNGWKFTPDVNIAATYDIVSDDMHSDVAWYGAAAEQVGLGRLSRAGMEAGVNLGVTYYGLGMSLGYNIDVRNHYVSHTGMLKFKYEF